MLCQRLFAVALLGTVCCAAASASAYTVEQGSFRLGGGRGEGHGCDIPAADIELVTRELEADALAAGADMPAVRTATLKALGPLLAANQMPAICAFVAAHAEKLRIEQGQKP